MLDYYVYAYINELTHMPYYIGMGKNHRAYKPHHLTTVPSDHTFIVILESNLSQIGAWSLERRYIKWYGIKANQTGILENIHEGGPIHNGGKKPYYHPTHQTALPTQGKGSKIRNKLMSQMELHHSKL